MPQCCDSVATVLRQCCDGGGTDMVPWVSLVHPLYIPCTSLVHPLYSRGEFAKALDRQPFTSDARHPVRPMVSTQSCNPAEEPSAGHRSGWRWWAGCGFAAVSPVRTCG